MRCAEGWREEWWGRGDEAQTAQLTQRLAPPAQQATPAWTIAGGTLALRALSRSLSAAALLPLHHPHLLTTQSSLHHSNLPRPLPPPSPSARSSCTRGRVGCGFASVDSRSARLTFRSPPFVLLSGFCIVDDASDAFTPLVIVPRLSCYPPLGPARTVRASTADDARRW